MARRNERDGTVRVAAILPAYNEQSRIAEVLKSVIRASSVDEIIVVNDGSTDGTAAIAGAIPGVKVINMDSNRGKGAAMMAGAKATKADILVFLDADLMGLRPEHVDSLVTPVKSGRCKMSVGSFRGGRFWTDWAQKKTPHFSGQRAMRRNVLLQIPDLDTSRYGVEMAITKYCHHYRVPTEVVLIVGVTHPMKEEKLGLIHGTLSRARMYFEIAKIKLDPRAPKRVRPNRVVTKPNLLQKVAGARRLRRTTGGTAWLYQRGRSWKRRRQQIRNVDDE